MFAYWHATVPKGWETYVPAPSCGKPLLARSAQEAKRLCGGALSIYAYHGGNRKKDPAFLAEFDIVVTTYGIVQVPFVAYPSSWRLRLDGTVSKYRDTHVMVMSRHVVFEREFSVLGVLSSVVTTRLFPSSLCSTGVDTLEPATP